MKQAVFSHTHGKGDNKSPNQVSKRSEDCLSKRRLGTLFRFRNCQFQDEYIKMLILGTVKAQEELDRVEFTTLTPKNEAMYTSTAAL